MKAGGAAELVAAGCVVAELAAPPPRPEKRLVGAAVDDADAAELAAGLLAPNILDAPDWPDGAAPLG